MATTEVLNPARGTVDEPRKLLDGRKGLVTAYGLFLGLLTLMIVTGETGPGNLRNTEALPADYPVYQRNGGLRANEAVLGWDGWIYLWQTIGFGGGLAILGYYGWKSWQSRSLHFMVIISLAAGGMFAFDPFYNWLGYFPTDPAFLHIPHGALPWSDLAPTFEPVFFFPLYIVWLVVPALITRALYTRLKARGFSKHGASAFMTRHPLLTVIIASKCVTFPLDLAGFRMGCLTEAFIFTQAPGPLIAGGTTGQAQWLWEPLLFELTMLACTLAMYRGRDGLLFHERVAPQLRMHARFPGFAQFTAAWTLMAFSYVVCLTGMGALRFTGQVDKLGTPWPYADTQVYDPDGLYDAACQPGQKREGSGNWDLIRPEAVGPCAKG